MSLIDNLVAASVSVATWGFPDGGPELENG
jgi:hypothetical protein